jgi:hypothetical protein
MNASQVNQAVAECLGWKKTKATIDVGFIETIEKDVDGWISPRGVKSAGNFDLPNFFGDLNAVALAEATLTNTEWINYNVFLTHALLHERLFAEVGATAPQRCEAFLRVKGAIK